MHHLKGQSPQPGPRDAERHNKRSKPEESRAFFLFFLPLLPTLHTVSSYGSLNYSIPSAAHSTPLQSSPQPAVRPSPPPPLTFFSPVVRLYLPTYTILITSPPTLLRLDLTSSCGHCKSPFSCRRILSPELQRPHLYCCRDQTIKILKSTRTSSDICGHRHSVGFLASARPSPSSRHDLQPHITASPFRHSRMRAGPRWN